MSRFRLPAAVVAWDVLLAFALLLLGEAEVLSGQVQGPRLTAVLFAVLMSVPFLLRRIAPIPVAVFVTAAFALQTRLGVDPDGEILTILVVLLAVYSVAVRRNRVESLLVAAFVLALVTVGRAVHGAGNATFAVVVVGVGLLVGQTLQRRRQQTEQLAELTEQLRREQAERERTAALEERARIARELHDVVAHAVSVMVVQAGAAERLLRDPAADAGEPLAAIQDSGRAALAELRRLLGVLRSDPDEPTHAPQPAITDLDALVEQLRRSGLEVDAAIEGNPQRLPTGLALAAYRIVQEALTNTLKHAAGAAATVRVRYLADALELEILDDGNGRATAADGPGHGLVGMRERAALYGGTVTAKPRPEGGFQVCARLPLELAT